MSEKNDQTREESGKKAWSAPKVTTMDTRSTQSVPGPNPTPDGAFFPAS